MCLAEKGLWVLPADPLQTSHNIVIVKNHVDKNLYSLPALKLAPQEPILCSYLSGRKHQHEQHWNKSNLLAGKQMQAQG